MFPKEDILMAKLSIAYMDIYYSDESDDYEEIIEYIDSEVIFEALEKNRRTRPVEPKVTIIAKDIFELARANYENDNN